MNKIKHLLLTIYYLLRNKRLLLAVLCLPIILLSVYCFLPSSASAALSYDLLEPIPGFENVTGNDFGGYVLAIYKFGIWTVGIAAMLMITIGGFMYFTSAGNTAKIGQAKQVIYDAIFGLIIAMAAYLILYVINPELVNVNVAGISELPPVPTSEDKEYPIIGTPWPVAGLPPLSDVDARNRLQAAGIQVNKANCTLIGQTGCTSLDGIPESTINKLIADRSIIGSFIVTGGTEYWLHKSHGPGKPVIDVFPTSSKSQWQNILNKLILSGGASSSSFCDLGGSRVPCTSASHLHLVF